MRKCSKLTDTRFAHIHAVNQMILGNHCNRYIGGELVKHHQKALVSAVVHPCYNAVDVVFVDELRGCRGGIGAEITVISAPFSLAIMLRYSSSSDTAE